MLCFLDINECAQLEPMCGVKAKCQNTDGSYKCACEPGYTGDGTTECYGMLA